VRTRVGYAGGTKEQPTYRDLGDHSEAVEVVFDPAALSFDDLLGVFWQLHAPTRRSWSNQYRAAVFARGPDQLAAALASRDRVAARLGDEVHTAVEEAGEFWPAEAYHQKHGLRRHRGVWGDLERVLGGEWKVVDSTLGARLNGIAAGYGEAAQAHSELERLDLKAADRVAVVRALRILSK